MSLAVTLDLPETMVRELRNTAKTQRRSIAEFLRDLVLQNWQPLPKLPDHVEAELAAMSSLSDNALWTLARSTMSLEHQERLALLSQEVKLRLLSLEEGKDLGTLRDEYEETMVRRAEAASLLMKRGYDMSNPRVLQPR